MAFKEKVDLCSSLLQIHGHKRFLETKLHLYGSDLVDHWKKSSVTPIWLSTKLEKSEAKFPLWGLMGKSETVGWWSSRLKVLTLEEELSHMQGDKRSLLFIQKARRKKSECENSVLQRSSSTWIMLSFKEAFGQYWRTQAEVCESGFAHSKEAADEVNLLHVLLIVMYFSKFVFL